MRNTLKDLKRRVARLELLLSPLLRPGWVWVESLEPAERDGLATNERIVRDHYHDAAGETVMASERITGDPSDVGKRFPDGSWDRKSFDACKRHTENVRVVWRTNPSKEGTQKRSDTQPDFHDRDPSSTPCAPDGQLGTTGIELQVGECCDQSEEGDDALYYPWPPGTHQT